jgi:uncharacterized membrane protein YphA (DoxX/SURF4 family)
MKKLLTEIAAVLLVILFTYAGISKLMQYEQFRFQLGQSPYVASFAGFVAWFMPAAEIAVAAMLAFTRTRLPGFYASFLIMLLFTGYIYIMMKFSPYLPCSCGGVLSMMSWEQHLYFNLFFVLLAVAGVLTINNENNSVRLARA